MYRLLNFRLTVEASDGNLYYPQVLNFSISESYPFMAPLMTCEVLSNLTDSTGTTHSYISPIRADNIVRMQYNIRYSTSEKSVWLDVFEGRVTETPSTYGTKNTTTLSCKGHAEEALYTLIRSDYSWSSASTDTIIQYAVENYLSRIEYDSSYFDTGTTLTSYNVSADQVYVSDVIAEIEKLEGYDMRFSTRTAYTSAGLLDHVYADWSALSSTPSEQYKIMEGTPRFISAEFKRGIDALYNYAVIYGQQTDPQKAGSASNATSITNYGTRYYVTTETALSTNQICSDIAAAIVAKHKDPLVSGQVKLIFTPEAKPGDLVTCFIPSLEVNGSGIDDDYRVVRVQHSMSGSGASTTLDVGNITLDPLDILTDLAVKNRISLQNFIM